MNRTLNVLMIDDNTVEASLFERLLRQNEFVEFNIDHANDLEKAYVLCEEKQYDVALLDLMIPPYVGVESLHKFKDKCPNIPVIVMSGLTNEMIAQETIKMGAIEFVPKVMVGPKKLINGTALFSMVWGALQGAGGAQALGV